jgi:hypothetical protein
MQIEDCADYVRVEVRNLLYRAMSPNLQLGNIEKSAASGPIVWQAISIPKIPETIRKILNACYCVFIPLTGIWNKSPS